MVLSLVSNHLTRRVRVLCLSNRELKNRVSGRGTSVSDARLRAVGTHDQIGLAGCPCSNHSLAGSNRCCPKIYEASLDYSAADLAV